MPLYDAHIHLTDSEYSSYLPHVICSLKSMNIIACSVAVNLETSLRSFELFKSSRDVVRQFVGIHPEFAETEDVEKFADAFNSNLGSIDGVGEIGLDRSYVENRGSSFDRQSMVFKAMLELAERAGKPVSIHSRRALDDILEILPSYKIKGTLLHWFAGSKKQLNKSMDMGLYVSYGPVLVYSDDKKVLLKNTRKDKFLVETDGPVRYSKCFAEMPAMSSSFLVSVVASAASTLSMSYEEAAKLIEKNTETFLGA